MRCMGCSRAVVDGTQSFCEHGEADLAEWVGKEWDRDLLVKAISDQVVRCGLDQPETNEHKAR